MAASDTIATAAHGAIVRAASGSGEFLGVDWGSIVLVFVVSLIATFVVVTFYSLGMRLLAVGSPDDDGDQDQSRAVSAGRPMIATVGAWACIAIGAVGVIYGIYLVVPLFH
jgi:hypothetical protein